MKSSKDLAIRGRPVGRGNSGPELPDLGDKFLWMSQGLCNGDDPEKWFTPEDVELTKDAVKICKLCPVQLNCMKFAMENGEAFGTWGGVDALVLLSPLRGRRALRRLESRKDEWDGSGT